MLQTRIKNRLVRRGIVALALLATLLGCTTNGGTTDERRSSTPVVAEQTFDEAEAAFGRGDYATAMEGFRVHAEQGNATAQFYLGLVYENGVVGVPEDDAEAVKWLRKAAEQGEGGAQYRLGLKYDNGWSVPEDDAEAVKWFRKAAEQGDSRAQYSLGVMYAKGEGVPKNDAEAAKWFRKAAEDVEWRLLGAEERRRLEAFVFEAAARLEQTSSLHKRAAEFLAEQRILRPRAEPPGWLRDKAVSSLDNPEVIAQILK